MARPPSIPPPPPRSLPHPLTYSPPPAAFVPLFPARSLARAHATGPGGLIDSAPLVGELFRFLSNVRLAQNLWPRGLRRGVGFFGAGEQAALPAEARSCDAQGRAGSTVHGRGTFRLSAERALGDAGLGQLVVRGNETSGGGGPCEPCRLKVALGAGCWQRWRGTGLAGALSNGRWRGASTHSDGGKAAR